MFTIGETYHRVEDVHDPYGGGQYRGIAASGDYPYVFLFTGEAGTEHGYEDEFRSDGTFLYTGEGREGDMTMNRGNAAIREHKSDSRELHVFENRDEAWMVTYVGQYEYEDHHWLELPDSNGNYRDAVRFELVPVGGTEIELAIDDIDSLSQGELYEQAAAVADHSDTVSTPGTTTAATSYSRSEVVRRYALRAADGVCQGCNTPPPFEDEDGEPYLEVHHMHRRSDGGLDHPDNVVTLCPNCHRRVHHGRDGDEFNQSLIDQHG